MKMPLTAWCSVDCVDYCPDQLQLRLRDAHGFVDHLRQLPLLAALLKVVR